MNNSDNIPADSIPADNMPADDIPSEQKNKSIADKRDKSTAGKPEAGKTDTLITEIVFLIASLGGLIASLFLTLDFIEVSSGRGGSLECDLSGKVSCTTVAQSWQSVLIHAFGKDVPNAVIGLIGYTVFVTIAVILLTKVILPKAFMLVANTGIFLALIFAYWLFYQSAVVINAICPWCITMMFSTTLMFCTFTRMNMIYGNFDFSRSAKMRIQRIVNCRIDILVYVILFVVLAGLVFFECCS